MRTLIPCILLAAVSAGAASENWPQWRGPLQNGVSAATGLPSQWSDAEGILWKSPLPSWSGGTPIVWGDRVFVTSPSAPEAAPPPEEGRRRKRHPGGDDLMLLCLSRADGRELWRAVLAGGNRTWRKHNNTSPSPVTDGRHVWAVTGTGVVAAYTVEGEPVWRRDLQAEFGAFGLMWGLRLPRRPCTTDGSSSRSSTGCAPTRRPTSPPSTALPASWPGASSGRRMPPGSRPTRTPPRPCCAPGPARRSSWPAPTTSPATTRARAASCGGWAV